MSQKHPARPVTINRDPAWGPLGEAAMRRRLEAEGFHVSLYNYTPGTYFPPHTHSVHKKDTVLRGRLKIGWEGGSVILEPGDMIEIPAGFSHSAEVVGSETVVSLDATKSA
jgi:quercetin dioxygenase-like cupin family protein